MSNDMTRDELVALGDVHPGEAYVRYVSIDIMKSAVPGCRQGGRHHATTSPGQAARARTRGDAAPCPRAGACRAVLGAARVLRRARRAPGQVRDAARPL